MILGGWLYKERRRKGSFPSQNHASPVSSSYPNWPCPAEACFIIIFSLRPQSAMGLALTWAKVDVLGGWGSLWSAQSEETHQFESELLGHGLSPPQAFRLN